MLNLINNIVCNLLPQFYWVDRAYYFLQCIMGFVRLFWMVAIALLNGWLLAQSVWYCSFDMSGNAFDCKCLNIIVHHLKEINIFFSMDAFNRWCIKVIVKTYINVLLNFLFIKVSCKKVSQFLQKYDAEQLFSTLKIRNVSYKSSY